MEKNFGAADWKKYIPVPVCEEHPEYEEFYNKAWELAYDHIRDIPGMVQNPYMDEAFCATQIWIWDTCFMSLFCKYAREVFPGVETLNNFYGTLYEGKELPVIMPPENEPVWTGAVYGQPYQIKVHITDNPPLFAWAEYENALMSGDLAYIKTLLYERQVLQKHYEWMENLHEMTESDKVLCPTCWIADPYGYKWEGGRSGMDNTPRGRAGEHAKQERPNNPDMLWVDAICEQAMAANTIAKLYALVGDTKEEKNWKQKYEQKKKVIQELYWDEKDQFFYDIDCNTHEFYKVKTIGSYWALTSETAKKEQAEALAAQMQNPETFGGCVPFVSLARNDGDYSSSGKYWRGAVWLPTAYAALKGFAAYGFYKEAQETALQLVDHMYKTYRDYAPHTIWECYHPEKHEPALDVAEKHLVRKDFCGWSALGPIAVYIEFVLGFHTIDAFKKLVKWEKPDTFTKKIGIKNLHFGNIVTDILAEGDTCLVSSNEAYTLEINGKSYEITPGTTQLWL